MKQILLKSNHSYLQMYLRLFWIDQANIISHRRDKIDVNPSRTCCGIFNQESE